MSTLIRCPNSTCAVPLAQEDEDGLAILRQQNGKDLRVRVTVEHFDRGYYRVRCDRCRASRIFASFKDTISVR